MKWPIYSWWLTPSYPIINAVLGTLDRVMFVAAVRSKGKHKDKHHNHHRDSNERWLTAKQPHIEPSGCLAGCKERSVVAPSLTRMATI